jgi:energy-coupling factor transporter transmembrane protein EcfT
MHPGAWLVWALCGAVVVMVTTNPFYLIPLFAVAWFVHAVLGRPGPRARSFKVFALLGLASIATRTALVVFLPEITAGSVAVAALEGLRLAVLLAVFGAFNSVSDPYGILRLAPRRFHEPALAAALALSLAPRTIEAVGSVREAQRMRGIETKKLKAVAALAVPVLETGMEEAVTLAESMDARGHGRGRRSHYRQQRWDLGSCASIAASLTCVTFFAVFIERGSGGLSGSGVPLEWPQASAWLIGAILLLALPAVLPVPSAGPSDGGAGARNSAREGMRGRVVTPR